VASYYPLYYQGWYERFHLVDFDIFAYDVSQTQQRLVNTVCELDEELDQKLVASGKAIGAIQRKLASLNKRIELIEFPQVTR